jgi:hypothetical protein
MFRYPILNLCNMYFLNSLFLTIREMSPLMVKDRDGSPNVSLLAIQPPDAAANSRKFYWIQSPWKFYIIHEALNHSLTK